ncbi:MAG: nicotinamide riboside transporter PnuC [Gemmatimonadales bacterium]
MNTIELVAAILVLVSVYLSTQEKIWAWPTAILAVTLYALVFWQARLFAQVGLQVFFFSISVYGWYYWLHGGVGRTELRVSRITAALAALSAVAWVAGTVLLWWVLVSFTENPAMPGLDAGLSVASLIAQWLLSRKILENWLIWVAADVAYVGLFVSQKLYFTTVLYVVLTGLASKGYLDWRRSLPSEKREGRSEK